MCNDVSLSAVSVPRGKFSKFRAALLCTHDTCITHKIHMHMIESQQMRNLIQIAFASALRVESIIPIVTLLTFDSITQPAAGNGCDVHRTCIEARKTRDMAMQLC
jgi:hypothetical protein